MENIKLSIKSILLCLVVTLFASAAQAYSPAARFDMVPYQRIENGGSLKVGVVAFSKPGVASVEFNATGQGYSGGAKSVTSMSFNSDSGVWEYWTTFSANEFSSNGAITITAIVTDNNANTRNLSLSMFAYGASAFVPVTIWIDDTGGNDSTCTVDNEAAPCTTLATAVTKVKAANGGVCDGAVFYYQEGTYTSESVTVTTSAQWATITKDADANRNNVILNGGSSRISGSFVKFDSITMQSLGSSSYVATPTRLWTNNCRKLGSGRWVSSSNPILFSDPDYHWSTNDYTYNVDFAYNRAALVRGATISTVGNDTFQNTRMVVNCTMDDSDHGTNYSTHNDGFQVFNTSMTTSPPADNRIIYNYKATNMHYQGIFMRSDLGTATDNAFVNVVMEMRDPANLNESGNYPHTAFALYHSWDHLIVWNCSFLWGGSEIYTSGLTNASIVGNVFFDLASTETTVGNPVVTSMAPSNSGNNEVTDNHFEFVYGGDSCTYLARSCDTLPAPDKVCPRYYAKRPDSDAGVSSTIGGEVIDLDSASATFLAPVDSSTLVDRFPSRVPVDVNNLERGATSDVGAVELSTGASTSGTITADNMTESTMVSGGATLDIIIAHDTLEADISAYRAEFIASCVSAISAGTEPAGWNAEIVADEVVTAITRVNDTLLRWTLSANAAYSIDRNDGNITCYIPHEMLVIATDDVVPIPSFFISNEQPISSSPQNDMIYSATGPQGVYSATGATIVDQ